MADLTGPNPDEINGDVAHGTADGGNPVKIGGYAASGTPAAVTNAQRVNAWFGLTGAQAVGPIDNGTTGALGDAAGNSLALAIGMNGANGVPRTSTYGLAFNGTTWDRLRTEAGTTGFLGVGGSVAHGATDGGNPVKIGGYASIVTPTAVATGQRVNARFGLYGDQYNAISDPDSAFAAVISPFGEVHTGATQIVITDSLLDGVDAGVWSTTAANGGTATTSGGEGLLQTSANANGSVILQSIVTPTYMAGYYYTFGAEIRVGDTGFALNSRRWGVFTVSGTTPQDGYYFELSGTTLNAVACKAGTPTAVASGSWTRAATAPFTLDTNYHRWEVRYAGSLVLFVIDGVVRHVLTHITGTTRTAALNLPITIQNTNAASAATNAVIGGSGIALLRLGGSLDLDSMQRSPNAGSGVTAVGVGPGFDIKANPANLGVTVGNSISAFVNGAATVDVAIGTTTTGTFVFEVTSDDVNWTGALVMDLQSDGWNDGGSITPASGNRYQLRVNGARQWRIRTNATLGATVAVKYTMSMVPSFTKGVHVGPAPHSFGWPLKTATVQLTASSTGTDVLTVTAGKTLVVTSYQIQAGGTVGGTVQLYFGTGTYARGTNRAIFDGEFAPSSTSKPGALQAGVWMAAAVSTQLRVASSAAVNPLTVTVWGYEF